ncbi:hypothetical protein ZWY2020_044847 [Hordeum vulgare]|nr:hypothetical protein ZWY2020_044847 [Hordeum vulgare]
MPRRRHILFAADRRHIVETLLKGRREGDEEVKRVTKGTDVHVKINLDGTGVANSSTGIPFLDHMLDQLASHGLFDVYVKVLGDIHIDDHHSNEDIALAIGTALLQALGDRKGINRFAHFTAPLDEAAVEVILDLSGRPHLSCGLSIPTERVGTYDTQALLQALGDRKGINRFAHFTAPLDEAAVEVILDLSGRPHLSCGLSIPTERVGTYDTQLVLTDEGGAGGCRGQEARPDIVESAQRKAEEAALDRRQP